ncbi:hypothetical protein QUB22_18430 [Microcoleus sp. AT9_A5]
MGGSAADFVADLTDGLLVGGSAADFVTDLTDGLLVGGRFGSGFCNGFNGWVAGWWGVRQRIL